MDRDLPLLSGLLEGDCSTEPKHAAQILSAYDGTELGNLLANPVVRIEIAHGRGCAHGNSPESWFSEHVRDGSAWVRFKTPQFRIGAMSRPADPPLERLRRKVWVRDLRIRMSQSQDPAMAAAANDLATMSRFLIQELDKVAMLGHDQRIRGVYGDGTDPQRLFRRVPLEEMSTPPDPRFRVVTRKQSGPAGRGDGKRRKLQYQEIPLDLIERGEEISPGSADWHSAPLWWLAISDAPELISLRSAMTGLKEYLGLCNPSLQVLQDFLEARDFNQISTSTEEARRERYSKSLSLLSSHPSAAGLSLLGALIVEDFLTENVELIGLHQDHFGMAVSRLLSHRYMQDIAPTFNELITHRFMTASWELTPNYHVSSIDRPFMPIADLKRKLPWRKG